LLIQSLKLLLFESEAGHIILFYQVNIIEASFQDNILLGYDAASLGNFEAM
jgi:hypothetical protein